MILVGYGRSSASFSDTILTDVDDAIWDMAYDATDTTTVSTSGSNVVTWEDKTSNGYDLTQGTVPAGSSAVYTSGQYVTYDNAADCLHKPSGISIGTSPKALFIRARPTGSAKQFAFSSWGTAAADWAGIAQVNAASTFCGTNITGAPDIYINGTLRGEDGNASLNRTNVYNNVWPSGAAPGVFLTLEVRGFVLGAHSAFYLMQWQDQESGGSSSWAFIGDIAWAGVCDEADAVTYASAIRTALASKA